MALRRERRKRMGNRQALLEEEEVENILVRKHFENMLHNLVGPVFMGNC